MFLHTPTLKNVNLKRTEEEGQQEVTEPRDGVPLDFTTEHI